MKTSFLKILTYHEKLRSTQRMQGFIKRQVLIIFSAISLLGVEGTGPFYEGAIRLVGGRNDFSGNVQILHLGVWKWVCDDEWTLKNAHVVCKEMGMLGAQKETTNSEFGEALNGFWLDNVKCFGEENSLKECRSHPWGKHDCSSFEAAGVQCRDFEAKSLSITTSKGQDFYMRIVGGSSISEGHLEVKFGEGKSWGLVCANKWTLVEANVVCKQMGLGFASKATHAKTTDIYFSNKEFLIRTITCKDKRSPRIEKCDHERFVGKNESRCFPGKRAAAVVCTTLKCKGDACIDLMKRMQLDLADLVPDEKLIEKTMYIEEKQLMFLRCAMEENCLSRSAYEVKEDDYMFPYITRKLLRFTSRIVNMGNADFITHVPKTDWEWHMCHMHYHSMDVFSEYALLDAAHKRVAQGHKASFCLEDNECKHKIEKPYKCENYGDQGIHPGCADIYEHNIDCQWIDLTDVRPGTYTFKISINPEQKVAELDYVNNVAYCNIKYDGKEIRASNCTLGES